MSYRPRNSSLRHYGVKGMKWGVRRNRNTHTDKDGNTVRTRRKSSRIKRVDLSEDSKRKARKPSDDAAAVAAIRRKHKTGRSLDTLSNKELRAYTERAQLEEQYRRVLQKQEANTFKGMIKAEIRKQASEIIASSVKQVASSAVKEGTKFAASGVFKDFKVSDVYKAKKDEASTVKTLAVISKKLKRT